MEVTSSTPQSGPSGVLALDRLSAAVSSLLSATSEARVWRLTSQLLVELVGAEAALGLEFISPVRAVFRSETAFSNLRLADPLPVSPDSQAAYVARADDVVRSDDVEGDHRFTAGSVLVERGLKSSISSSVALGPDAVGVIGAFSAERAAFSDDDVEVVKIIASIAGSAISELRSRRLLEATARSDDLTSIWNRKTVLDMLGNRLDAGLATSLLMMDLDGFKAINDRHGHGVGDRVLQVIARRVERAISPRDRFGRLGGDEFVVIVDNDDPLHAERMATRIVGLTEEIIRLSALALQVSSSIGIAFARDDDVTADLLRRADQLMYEAKAAGQGQIRYQRDAEKFRSQRRVAEVRSTSQTSPSIDVQLVDEAIAGLRVALQPIVHADNLSLAGAEALTRGPEGHPLEYPDSLFPAAYTFGRLGELELAAKRAAFAADIPDDVTLFVNVEPRLLAAPGWLDRLRQVWREADWNFRVVVEVTERDVLSSPGRLLEAVRACRELGWWIALDDVGNRTESLAALRWLEPDIVKLDTGLIDEHNRAHTTHVGAAIGAYHNDRPLHLVAEGVETERHVEIANSLNVGMLQGYMFGRPGSLEQLVRDQTIRQLPEPTKVLAGQERIGTKQDLIDLSRHIESVAVASDAVVLATLQRSEFLTERTRMQYAALSRRCGFVGLIAHGFDGLDPDSIPGVRLAEISASDPLAGSWHVVATSPTVSLALIAEEIPVDDDVPDGKRPFRYRFLTAPEDVDAAARNLLERF